MVAHVYTHDYTCLRLYMFTHRFTHMFRERERFITSDIVLTILLGMALLETQKFTGYTNFKYKLSIFWNCWFVELSIFICWYDNIMSLFYYEFFWYGFTFCFLIALYVEWIFRPCQIILLSCLYFDHFHVRNSYFH